MLVRGGQTDNNFIIYINKLNIFYMKSAITFAILLASGSLFYYYVYFLPLQNIQSQQDINAIRSIIAPTVEQQQVQAQREAQSEKAINDYFVCEQNMQKKIEVWLEKQCSSNPNNPMDVLKQMDCRSKAMTSSGAKQFECPKPF